MCPSQGPWLSTSQRQWGAGGRCARRPNTTNTGKYETQRSGGLACFLAVSRTLEPPDARCQPISMYTAFINPTQNVGLRTRVDPTYSPTGKKANETP